MKNEETTEVKPYVPDAWIDETKTKIGYEINFTRYFWKYQPIRASNEIMEDIEELEINIKKQIESLKNE